MRTALATLPLLAVLGAWPALAAAPFAGTIEMKITTDHGGNGNIKMTIGSAGVVNELTMQGPQGSMAIKSILKKDKPDFVYLVNDTKKSYVQLPANGPMPPQSDETWTIKKVGKETIAGYPSVHVQGTSSQGNAIELWTTKNIMDAEQYAKAMGAGRNNSVTGSVMAALKEKHLDGFPVKMIAKGKAGGTTTMELVKVKKGAVPASTFDIPSGYQEASMGPPMGAIPPEVQKKIQEKLDSMTPEQREAMKKAMAH